jgi:hypothetical protein
VNLVSAHFSLLLAHFPNFFGWKWQRSKVWLLLEQLAAERVQFTEPTPYARAGIEGGGTGGDAIVIFEAVVTKAALSLGHRDLPTFISIADIRKRDPLQRHGGTLRKH